jgi:hypothetical protein
MHDCTENVNCVIGITCIQCRQHEKVEQIKTSEESHYKLQQL